MIAKILADKLLKSLERLEQGSLSITMPNGKAYGFEGKLEGPKAHLDIHDWSVLTNAAYKGDIGFAEDYKAGKWRTDDLVGLVELGLLNHSAFQNFILGNGFFRAVSRLRYALNANTLKGSKNNIHAHYDLGNAFYKLWLDPSMTYSSAIFKNNNEPLTEAQNNKYDRILDCLDTHSGRILEVGCGWGGFADRAQTKGDYALKGITLSEEQHAYARSRLENKADIALEDYRHQEGQYDSIVSIEMFEAVGEEFWKTYFQKMGSLLKTKGKAVIQTITMNGDNFERYRRGGDFIRSYIFPGGMLPSVERFKQEAAKAGLKSENTFSFGQDYALTLIHWLDMFEQKKDEVKNLGFDDGFIRLWRLYLAACIAGFKTGRTDVMQIELSHA